MIYKLLGVLLIGAAATIAYLSFQSENNVSKRNTSAEECKQLTPAELFTDLIDEDFKSLARDKKLPAAWSSIATIEYKNNSELAKALLGSAKLGIQRVKEGSSYLEIQLMDLPDETNPGVILQASLFDIKSKNKIFEIGRTYTMNELNHQTQPSGQSQPTKKEMQNSKEEKSEISDKNPGK